MVKKLHTNRDCSFFSFSCVLTLAGTPATVSQMAKDVTTFLRWASGKCVHTLCVHFLLYTPVSLWFLRALP